MSDFNDIFGYKVYKPPPEKNLPVELVTLIDSNADVIQDPAVQNILKSLDGERTVKIQDLPPDVRYDGWNKKAHYDQNVISHKKSSNLQPKLPVINQNLIKENEKSYALYQEALDQAKKKAVEEKKVERELSLKLNDTRLALEKEIQRQLIEQLKIRAKNKSVTPDQQALIEKLYIDLRLINAELAFSTLKSFAIYEAKKRVSEQNQAHTSKTESAQRQAEHRQHRSQPNKIQMVQPQLNAASQHVKISTEKRHQEHSKAHRPHQEPVSQHYVPRSQEQVVPKSHDYHPHPNSRSHPNLHAHHSYHQQPHPNPNVQSHQHPQHVLNQNKNQYNTLSRSASKPNQDHPQELVHNRGSIVNSNSTQKHKPIKANTKPTSRPERNKTSA